jgi:hypothetical protein
MGAVRRSKPRHTAYISEQPDVEVGAHGVEEVAEFADVVGVWGQQVDGTRPQVAGRPDQLVGVPSAQQHASQIEHVPPAGVSGATVAVDQQDGGLPDALHRLPVVLTHGRRVAAEPTDRLTRAGATLVGWGRKVGRIRAHIGFLFSGAGLIGASPASPPARRRPTINEN